MWALHRRRAGGPMQAWPSGPPGRFLPAGERRRELPLSKLSQSLHSYLSHTALSTREAQYITGIGLRAALQHQQ